ncbi:MAG: FYDLN acid domain-containing protein [Nitrospinae bacterium]|nr:FYDLN acid domain-containing protein [Nitrospinota bacterium]MBI3813077.1 FYDLN acid domain-containing protein [Nitrospinota bacterium]
MTKSKYGNRYQCFKCGCKFYDLNKPKSICPKCGADQAEAPRHEKPSHGAAHRAAIIPPVEELLEEAIPVAEGEEELILDEGEVPLEIEEEEEF